MSTSSSTAPRAGDRSLLIIGAGVLALAVITVAVVLLAGDRRTADYPADVPEGALQRYLAAYEAGDLEAAYAFFSERVRQRMSLDDYQRSTGFMAPPMEGASRRVLFDRRSGEGDRVQLHLTIEEFYPDGIDGSTQRSPRQVPLVREGGAWRIDEALVWLDVAPMLESEAHP